MSNPCLKLCDYCGCCRVIEKCFWCSEENWFFHEFFGPLLCCVFCCPCYACGECYASFERRYYSHISEKKNSPKNQDSFQ